MYSKHLFSLCTQITCILDVLKIRVLSMHSKHVFYLCTQITCPLYVLKLPEVLVSGVPLSGLDLVLAAQVLQGGLGDMDAAEK